MLTAELCKDKVNCVIRQPDNAICEQQRSRPICAFTQSDQRLCCSQPSIIYTYMYTCVYAISKRSRLELASEAEQAGLSLGWSYTSEDGILVTWPTFIELDHVSIDHAIKHLT